MKAVHFARRFFFGRRKPENMCANNSAGQESDTLTESPETAEEPREKTCTPDTLCDTDVKDGYLQYQENGLWVRVDLKEGDTFVGRSNNVDCTLDSELVEGEHAQFIRSRENEVTEYYVKDISSDAGIYVDGERVQKDEKKPLTPGCEIRLADVRMTFFRRPTVEFMEKLNFITRGGNENDVFSRS